MQKILDFFSRFWFIILMGGAMVAVYIMIKSM